MVALGAVNYIAVVAATVVAMILGYAWYSPMLFGNRWIKLMGFSASDMKKGQKDMGKTMAYGVIVALVTAWVLAQFIGMLGAKTLVDGALVGVLAWIGFVATVMANDVIYGGKNTELYTLNAGYQLVALALMGAVIGVMG